MSSAHRFPFCKTNTHNLAISVLRTWIRSDWGHKAFLALFCTWSPSMSFSLVYFPTIWVPRESTLSPLLVGTRSLFFRFSPRCSSCVVFFSKKNAEKIIEFFCDCSAHDFQQKKIGLVDAMERFPGADIITEHIGIAYMNRRKHLLEQQKMERKMDKKAENRKTGEDDDEDEDEDGQSDSVCFFWSQLHRKISRSCKKRAVEVYYASQKYMHCELAFFLKNGSETGSKDVLAFGAASELGVFRKERTFSNPSYEWIFLKTTREQALDILFFCESCVGQSYDNVGVEWSKCWPSYPYVDKANKKTWWCSSFVVEALQVMGLFNTVIPQTLDIDDIIAFLEEHPLRIINLMTPFQLNMALEQFRKSAISEKKTKSKKKSIDGPPRSKSQKKK
jgi:hypothetical protein